MGNNTELRGLISDLYERMYTNPYLKFSCCKKEIGLPFLSLIMETDYFIEFVFICPRKKCLKLFEAKFITKNKSILAGSTPIVINHYPYDLVEEYLHPNTYEKVKNSLVYDKEVYTKSDMFLRVFDYKVKQFVSCFSGDDESFVNAQPLEKCVSNIINDLHKDLLLVQSIEEVNQFGGGEMKGLFKKNIISKKDSKIVTAIEENDGDLLELTLATLKTEAKNFCDYQETIKVPHLYGSSDGKAVGTYIEHEFKRYLSLKYSFQDGNSARGIDLPGDEILTDIKVTSIKQPQSSSPFKSARQKVYGLGYNLMLFVYKKHDDPVTQTSSFEFVSCAFIAEERTADYQTTKEINRILQNDGNMDDLFAFFADKNIPGDEIVYTQLAEEILASPPAQGYLTISNALQWRLQYKRIVDLPTSIQGIDKII